MSCDIWSWCLSTKASRSASVSALVLLVAAQRIADRRPVPRVALVGVQQLVAGVVVVVVTAVGVWRA